jgi:hypothetical protein
MDFFPNAFASIHRPLNIQGSLRHSGGLSHSDTPSEIGGLNAFRGA